MKAFSMFLAASVAIVSSTATASGDAAASGFPGDQQGQVGRAMGGRLAGLWRMEVSLGPCGGAATQRYIALNTFHPGGAVSDSNATAASSRGPGQGVWAHRGLDLYDARFQFFRLHPDGSPDAVQDVSQQIILAPSGRTYEAVIGARVVNLDGGIRAQLCGAAAGRRVSVDTDWSAAPPALEGTQWRPVSVDDGGGLAVEIPKALGATLAFNAKGARVYGFTGCNHFSAPGTLIGELLNIGALSVSKRLCGIPYNVMEIEERLLAALAQVAVAHVEGSDLQLLSRDGTIAIILVR